MPRPLPALKKHRPIVHRQIKLITCLSFFAAYDHLYLFLALNQSQEEVLAALVVVLAALVVVLAAS